jgi:hypothetical protein
LFEQQSAAVVPTMPFLAGSLNWPAGHDTLAPRHLVVSVSQQVSISAVLVHVEYVQLVVAAAAIFFLPGVHVEQVAVEQDALFVQHLVTLFCKTIILLLRKGLWNEAGPHFRVV